MKSHTAPSTWANKNKGEKIRCSNNTENEKKVKDLEFKIKMLTNKNRRLLRSLDRKTMLELPSTKDMSNLSMDNDLVGRAGSSVLVRKEL